MFVWVAILKLKKKYYAFDQMSDLKYYSIHPPHNLSSTGLIFYEFFSSDPVLWTNWLTEFCSTLPTWGKYNMSIYISTKATGILSEYFFSGSLIYANKHKQRYIFIEKRDKFWLQWGIYFKSNFGFNETFNFQFS